MLLGTMIAYPQPFASTCCCQVGPPLPPPGGPFGANPLPPNPPNPNSMITGTGPLASAGVVRVSWMSTVTAGYDELSTCPTSRLVTTGTSPTVCLAGAVACHVTGGGAF